MISESIIVLSIILVILAMFASWIWGGFNTLVGGRQNIKTMFSNMKTEYQRRADLFYNLAEAVKSYAKFEKDTLTQVIAMRNGNFGNNPKEAMKKMKSLDGFMSKLMLVFERYPDLKANQQYQTLMEETRVTENRINVVRTEYNDTVRDYNLFVVSFPSNVIAKMFNHMEEDYFECEEAAKKCPKMDLSIDKEVSKTVE